MLEQRGVSEKTLEQSLMSEERERLVSGERGFEIK